MAELWDWKPCISIGPIRFGMNRQVARNLLKLPFKESNESGTALDDFGFAKLYYNGSNKVTCIKIYDDIQIVYHKKTIFPSDVNGLVKGVTTLKVDSETCYLYDYNKQIIAYYDPDDGIINYIALARSNYWGED